MYLPMPKAQEADSLLANWGAEKYQSIPSRIWTERSTIAEKCRTFERGLDFEPLVKTKSIMHRKKTSRITEQIQASCYSHNNHTVIRASIPVGMLIQGTNAKFLIRPISSSTLPRSAACRLKATQEQSSWYVVLALAKQIHSFLYTVAPLEKPEQGWGGVDREREGKSWVRWGWSQIRLKKLNLSWRLLASKSRVNGVNPRFIFEYG